ncbi:hypothetical protein UFOVP308_24 [uncultured Caudovirales phage]|uniref:Uncharacterized protein n=1 Tax=uncultured Caudovirales phage TaxID=2100421 RepID=A0A6J5LS52_9CAUD|nr:hypothetical protein UFOVP308_24 [uncultured Caudovirales phage]
MAIYVQVGKDVIEFPDGMSDAQIEQAISGSAPKSEAPSSGFLMGLKDPITAGAQMIPRALGAVASLGGTKPNSLSDLLYSEAKRIDEMAKSEEQGYQAQRAKAGESGFDVARLGGNILNPASLVPAARAAQLARGAGVNMLGQTVAAGAVGGAMQPVVGEGTFGEQKTEQVVLGGVTAPIGEKVVKGVSRTINPLVSKAEQTMRDLGITPTTGQTLGGQFKTLEEFAQNMPLIGQSIQNAKQRVLFDFNKSVINKALAKASDPTKQDKLSLPADVIGRDAIEYASKTVSDKYDDVLSKMSFDLDFATTSNILGTLSKVKGLDANQRQTVSETLNDIVFGKFSGQKLDGQTYKGIESDLRNSASNYLNSGSASERNIGKALSDVLGVLKKELYFQNPKQTPTLRRIDAAYSDLSVINVAAANSGAKSGVFTPQQFSTAVRQQDPTRRKSSFAKGKAKGQDISDAALEVIGDTTGASQTGRLALGIGGGYGLLSEPAIGTATALGVPVAYSQGGQAAIDMLLRQRPELLQRLGGMLSQQATPIGAVGLPSAVGQYNRSERQ